MIINNIDVDVIDEQMHQKYKRFKILDALTSLSMTKQFLSQSIIFKHNEDYKDQIDLALAHGTIINI